MDNTLMIALSNQRVLRDRMDMIANNIANVSTTAFKAEALIPEMVSERPAVATDNPSDIRFVDGWALQRDMRAGPMQRTGNKFDFAIEGEGFFAVQTDDEVLYTRDGRFSPTAEGLLVDREGRPVLDIGGQPIQIDPDSGPATVTLDGSIQQGEDVVGQIGVTTFATPAALERVGDNNWRQTVEEPQAAEAPAVRQGFVEGSNVAAVLELTRMLDTSRAYERASRIVSDADDLRSRALDRLGRSQ